MNSSSRLLTNSLWNLGCRQASCAGVLGVYIFTLNPSAANAMPSSASSSSSDNVKTQLTKKGVSDNDSIRINKVLGAAKHLVDHQHFEDAKLMIGKILKEDPTNHKALCLMAQCAEGTGDEELAVEYLTKAISLVPKYGTYYRLRAKNLCVLGKGDLAKADIVKAIELKPNDALVYEDAGYVYANSNDYPKAVDAFTKAFSLHPHNLALLRKRAMALTQLGQFDKAIADYDYCIAQKMTDEEAFILKAQIYERKSQFAKAASVYRALWQAAPERINNLQRLTVALVRANLFDEALSNCNKLIGTSPDDDELYVLRARCYLSKQNPTKALKDLERSIALAGKGTKDIYLLRAKAHRSLGETRLANQDEAELKNFQN